MRWLGVARRAFDMLCERSLYRYVARLVLAEHETIQNWIADSEAEMQAARLMTLHAAWKMDTEGVAAARKEIALIKFYGAKVLHDVVDRALQAHGGARLLDRPAARGDVPLRPRGADLRRPRRGPPRVGRAPGPARLRAAADGVPTEFIPARREAARRQFADLLEAVTRRTTERGPISSHVTSRRRASRVAASRRLSHAHGSAAVEACAPSFRR